MSVLEIEELGPIDDIVLEWPGKQPTGEAAPLIVDLADRGIINILDVAFMLKREDGTVDATRDGRPRRVGLRGVRGRVIGPDRPGRPRGGRRRAEPRHAAPPCSCGRTAGRPRSRSRCAARRPAGRQRPPARPGHHRRARRRRGTGLIATEEPPCQDCSAGSPAPPPSPGPPPPSPIASRDARRAAGRPRTADTTKSPCTRPRPHRRIRSPAARRSSALRDQGILTDQEFADQKAKLLA